MSKKWFDSHVSIVEGAISYYDCRWNYSYDWRSNSTCLWLGHVCSSSTMQRITRGTHVNCKQKAVTRKNGLQVGHQISSRVGRNSSAKPTTTFHWLSQQATEHQTKALDDLKRTQAVGDQERSVETQLPGWLQPFTEGASRGSSSSTDVDVAQPLAAILSSSHPPATPHFKQLRRKAQCVHSFSRRPRIAKYADARKLRERHAEEIRTIGRTELGLPKDVGIWKQQTQVRRLKCGVRPLGSRVSVFFCSLFFFFLIFSLFWFLCFFWKILILFF